VLGLMRGGLSRDEAEEIAESVRLSTLNGGGSADGSQHP
jgi:hypothetical protein